VKQIFVVALWSAGFVLASFGSNSTATAGNNPYHHMLVANRASGSISQIDIGTNAVTNFALPMAANPADPMYIVYSPDNELVYVGDRGNNRLVVYNANDYATSIGEVPVGAGIFHMWGDANHNQLWVNNDIDKTVSVVDMQTASTITTFSTPSDLNALGGKPHDVFLNPNAPVAYVTMLGVSGNTDWVVKYSTDTFMELDRVEVGDDPHVSYSPSLDQLFAPTQGGGVAVIDASTFDVTTTINVPNSHGAWLSPDEATFYTTNIAAGGTAGLVSIDTATLTIHDSVDAPYSIPHNVITTPDQTRLYLTHSGGSNNKVSIYDVSDPASPVYLQSVTTGFNPYGIALISSVPEPSSLLLAVGGVALLCFRRR